MSIRIRRGLEANRTGITPDDGEPIFTTDEKKLYVGDGTTPGGVAISTGGGGAVDSVNGKTGVVTLSASDVGAATTAQGAKADSAVQTETDPTVPAWAKTPSKPSYTKTEVGLGNVDNTSDASKPISTATQTALNAKASTSSLATVATSGSYTDLTSKPTIPAQFNPVAGSNVTLTGTYPNITFTATTAGGGGGDMFKAVYDPTAKAADAFSQDNMADGTTNKNYTATEKTKLAGVSGTNTGDETTATIKTKLGVTTLSGSNTGDQDLSGLVPKTTTVNSYPLSSNVILTNTDVGAAATSHTHAVTDMTATGTRSSATYLRGDNTWVTPTNTTYTEITSAEIAAGTASTARAISGRRTQEIKVATITAAANYTDSRRKFY